MRQLDDELTTNGRSLVNSTSMKFDSNRITHF